MNALNPQPAILARTRPVLNDRLNRLFSKSFEDAAHSFSRLIQRDMHVESYTLQCVPAEAFTGETTDELEECFFASIIQTEKDLRSAIIFLISEDDGIRLYREVTGETVDLDGRIPVEVIAGIGELNNILGSTFLNCLAEALNQTIHGSTPRNTLDMLGAILESIVLQETFLKREVLCADATILEQGLTAFRIRMLILTDLEHLTRMIAA
jgi:chemotaxis protein CheY-P-specific phosphatase CheC